MSFKLTIQAATVAFALFSTAASAAVVTMGPGGFNGGYATQITYDDAAARGTGDDRADPLNALGVENDDFFEIGFGSFVDLTFGRFFRDSATVWEVTFGRLPSFRFDESVDVFAGTGIGAGFSGVKVGSVDNENAQDGFTLSFTGGPFETLRLRDTSKNPSRLAVGGFDVDAVKVSAVPVPASILLLGSALAGLGLMRRRKVA